MVIRENIVILKIGRDGNMFAHELAKQTPRSVVRGAVYLGQLPLDLALLVLYDCNDPNDVLYNCNLSLKKCWVINSPLTGSEPSV